MSASLHLARYRLGQVPHTLAAIRREWPALAATPGLGAVRLFLLADLDTVAGGTPRATRWGLLCGWEKASERDRFLEDGTSLRPFLRGAREALHVSLETVRVSKRDTWWGWRPDTDGVPLFAANEPVVVLTYGTIRPRHVGRVHLVQPPDRPRCRSPAGPGRASGRPRHAEGARDPDRLAIRA